jgi:hypothetical protein
MRRIYGTAERLVVGATIIGIVALACVPLQKHFAWGSSLVIGLSVLFGGLYAAGLGVALFADQDDNEE